MVQETLSPAKTCKTHILHVFYIHFCKGDLKELCPGCFCGYMLRRDEPKIGWWTFI
jgi:hypothetical protein